MGKSKVFFVRKIGNNALLSVIIKERGVLQDKRHEFHGLTLKEKKQIIHRTRQTARRPPG